jgi:hypothetical protein
MIHSNTNYTFIVPQQPLHPLSPQVPVQRLPQQRFQTTHHHPHLIQLQQPLVQVINHPLHMCTTQTQLQLLLKLGKSPHLQLQLYHQIHPFHIGAILYQTI